MWLVGARRPARLNTWLQCASVPLRPAGRPVDLRCRPSPSRRLATVGMPWVFSFGPRRPRQVGTAGCGEYGRSRLRVGREQREVRRGVAAPGPRSNLLEAASSADRAKSWYPSASRDPPGSPSPPSTHTEAGSV